MTRMWYGEPGSAPAPESGPQVGSSATWPPQARTTAARSAENVIVIDWSWPATSDESPPSCTSEIVPPQIENWRSASATTVAPVGAGFVGSGIGPQVDSVPLQPSHASTPVTVRS